MVKSYPRKYLFILVSLVSGMRIVFATQNQVRQCGPGIPTSPLQSMYWKFSRDIHFPIYSCALEVWGLSRALSVEKKSQIVATFDCIEIFSGLPCTTFLSTETLWLKPVSFSKTLKQVNLLGRKHKSHRRSPCISTHYGNTGCGVFKQGVQN